jgi:tetratricopeptide (TPR) repeat protein
MKKIIVLLVLATFSLNIQAQTPYEKGMQNAFDLWNEDKLVEASNLFERISTVEKDNWLPPFYAGYTLVLSAFEIKDESTLKLKLDKAKSLLEQAASISPKNPDIMIAQALHNTAYINFDGQKYGMTMSSRNASIYNEALKIAPENPRVILAKAEWDMGSARFFYQSTEPYCKDVQRALEIFESEEKPKTKFYPDWGKERAKQILEECKG